MLTSLVNKNSMEESELNSQQIEAGKRTHLDRDHADESGAVLGEQGSDSEDGVFCVCRKPHGDRFMIACDKCDEWFHGDCVGIDERKAKDIITYHCSKCQKVHGPGKVIKRRKTARKTDSIDYKRANETKNTKSRHMQYLSRRKFEKFKPLEVSGALVTEQYISENGLHWPLIFNPGDELGIKVPSSKLTVKDILKIAGDRELEVMDVNTQETLPDWTLQKWANYFSKPKERKQLLNVISFEFSDTPLDQLFERPKIVRDLDWIDKYWPRNAEKLDEFPKVQKYCLMSPAGCWTDFHLDFGGTSVFYHLLSGEKKFYMIPPTERNFQRYEKWCNSEDQSDVFFSDLVPKCYEIHLKAGMTMLIPSGWIHAVYTPADSIVFGGNFLHDFSIPLQLTVNKIESRCGTPDINRFPFYERLNWLAAESLLSKLKNLPSKCGNLELAGAESLADFLFNRSSRLAYSKKSDSKPCSPQERKYIRDSIPQHLKSSHGKYKKLVNELAEVICCLKLRRAPILNFISEEQKLDLTAELRKLNSYPHKFVGGFSS